MSSPNEQDPDTSTSDAAVSLVARLKQQQGLSKLGLLALQGPTLQDLLDQAVRVTAEGLGTEFCKVLEYQPDRNTLLLRAGVGWGEGVVGIVAFAADSGSAAGFAFQTGKPIISNDMENETRFRTPELLRRKGIHRAINVILPGEDHAYGVLEVDSRMDGEFSKDDMAFMQGAANILGMAIQNQMKQRQLQDALSRHQTLLMEVNHRVKNSLQVVSSMLNIQSMSSQNVEAKEMLNIAAGRIGMISEAYDHISYSADYEKIELVAYIRRVIEPLKNSVMPCELSFESDAKIQFAGDRAVLVALIMNELVLNAAKYAYADKAGRPIRVGIVRTDGPAFVLSVRDEGVGLPAELDAAQKGRLGTRLVNALSRQLHAEIKAEAGSRGAGFILTVPDEPA
jgi:two-component sensor histidine kinase